MPLAVSLPDDSDRIPTRRCLYCHSTNVRFNEELKCYQCLNPRCNEQWYYCSDTPLSALLKAEDDSDEFDCIEEIELPPGYTRGFDEPMYVDPHVYEDLSDLEDELD